jgi:signal transduction histidine kinase/ligand-binding sensor domain-containing protein
MSLQKKLSYFFFVVILFLSIYNKSVSQSYFIRNYSIETGLPTNNISDITQDLKGKMWFTTANGISIYDGFQLENMDNKTGLPGSRYRKIKTDEKGIIWCLPDFINDTIVYFENDSMKIIAFSEKKKNSDELSTTSLGIIYENDYPAICIGTQQGLYLYKNGNWKKFSKADGLPDDFIFSITEYNNKFYITTKNGLSVFDCYSFDNSINKLIAPKYADILAVAFDKEIINSNKKMWLLGKKWIGYIENNKLNILNDKFLLPTGIEFEYPSLVPGKNNLVFFGNFYYTYCINKVSCELFSLTHNEGFRSDGSTSIFLDREENLWQTGTRGIDKLNNLFFVNYYKNNGLLEDEVSAILEYNPGKYIIGHNNGISIMNDNKITLINFSVSEFGYPGNGRVLDICKGKDGTIWLACASRGICKLEKNGNIKWLKYNKEYVVSSVSTDKNGVVWITSNYGVYVIKNDKIEEPDNLNIQKRFYRRISFSNDNEMFLAFQEGLVSISGNKVKNYSLNGNDRANNVYAVYKDKNNRTFIGTKDGLYTLKNDTYEKYIENGFKIDIAVYSILQDSSGKYWFGTDNGVIKWDGKNEGIVYTKGNGLAGRETNRAALINDSRGNIWIGTESGLSCYRPEYDKNIVPVPTIFFNFTEDVEGNKYSLNRNVSIKNKFKSLNFNFRGISFYNENFIRYKIKLEGFDTDWYEVDQFHIDKIRYTNLVPGDYRLFVSAKNTSGEWSDIKSSSIITIEKPVFRKWWFILIFATVVVILLFSLYKLYMKRIYYLKLEEKVKLRTSELRETEKELRNTQILLEKKVEERTAKLGIANEQLKELNASKDKFFSIIAHDLKSPFIGLLGYTELLKSEIDNFSKKQIVEFSENIYKNLKNTYNLLENLLNWALLQTGRMAYNPEKIDLFLEIKSILELLDSHAKIKNIKLLNKIGIGVYIEADKNMIRTVIYNLVSNAIKFTNPGGSIIILSKEFNGDINITVSDDGVGIAKENLDKLFKIDSNISTQGTAKEKGTGLGLMLCKEMIEKHNGTISVESEIEKGTTFTVSLPVGNV